jgi:hypothetical protein
MEKNIIVENALPIKAAMICGFDLKGIGCSGNGKPKATEGHPGAIAV